jgi:undecaprenyl-diphosphatase
MNFIKGLSQKQIRMIFMGLIIIIGAILFEEIVDDVFSDPKVGDPETLVFDHMVLKKFQEIRGSELTQSMTDLTALGSVSVISLLTCVIVIFLVVHKDWKGLLYILIVISGSATIPVLLKNYFNRPRPDILEHLAIGKNTSFPSGHSFGATVAYFSLAFLFSREIKEIKLEILYYALAAMVVALVGTSRMYLGVHYPTDIAGGICVGMMWFSIVSIPFLYFTKTTDSL